MGNHPSQQSSNKCKIMTLCPNQSRSFSKQHNEDWQSSFLDSRQINDVEHQQTIYSQLYNVKSYEDISWMSLRNRLEEGVTIVSPKPDEKYLVHHVKFQTQKEYQKFTDSLLYRIKMLRGCIKSRKYFNQIVGIFAEKYYKVSCVACSSCTKYNVYIVERYLSNSLQNLLNEEKLCYRDIKSIFHSFCQVMAAYQYKRLRFGTINFSHIYVIRDPRKLSLQTMNLTSLSSILQFNNQNTIGSLKQNSVEQKSLEISNQANYVCKVSDPFVRDFILQKQKNVSLQEKKKSFGDIYKQEVLEVGTFLQEYIKERAHEDGSLPPQQESAKNFIQTLIKKYMKCQTHDRYNWLQIQRYFQQHNNKEVNIKQIPSYIQINMNSNTNSQLDYRYPENQYKSSSLDKLPLKSSTYTYHCSDFAKFMADKKASKINSSFNRVDKQNLSNNTSQYISLKPTSKNSLKPNLMIKTPTASGANPTMRPNSRDQLTNILRTPTNISIQNLNIQTTNFNNVNSSNNAKSLQYKQKQIANSGYGVVHNQFPEKPKDGKVQYGNLFTIEKTWSKFEGSFVDGCKEGPGTIYLTNGQIFTGFFSKDLANGKGSVYINGQLMLKGVWKNNILVTQF